MRGEVWLTSNDYHVAAFVVGLCMAMCWSHRCHHTCNTCRRSFLELNVFIFQNCLKSVPNCTAFPLTQLDLTLTRSSWVHHLMVVQAWAWNESWCCIWGWATFGSLRCSPGTQSVCLRRDIIIVYIYRCFGRMFTKGRHYIFLISE